jgi:hypothetical protein
LGLLVTDAPLVLEGLEFQRLTQGLQKVAGSQRVIVFGLNSPLYVANCRFRSENLTNCISTRSPDCELRNSEVLGLGGYALLTDIQSGQHLTIDNCTSLQTESDFHFHYRPFDVNEAALVRLTRNTCVQPASVGFRFGRDEMPSAPPRGKEVLRLEASGNIFDARSVFHFVQDQPGGPLPARQAEAWLAQLVSWQGQANLYALNGPFLWLDTRENDLEPARPITSLAEWRRFWESAEADSTEGPVRYQGGDLRAKLLVSPEQLTPEDFRLRPDSAAYRARNWVGADRALAACAVIDPGDGPTLHLRERIARLSVAPPQGDWDGIWRLAKG